MTIPALPPADKDRTMNPAIACPSKMTISELPPAGIDRTMNLALAQAGCNANQSSETVPSSYSVWRNPTVGHSELYDFPQRLNGSEFNRLTGMVPAQACGALWPNDSEFNQLPEMVPAQALWPNGSGFNQYSRMVPVQAGHLDFNQSLETDAVLNGQEHNQAECPNETDAV
ncbi:MAG: hypothetical protein M1839_003651 [Geoglossum umbratile]|nr:MAG: hypothetical protein M1839_003651 [Geoglossum umbratile]